jgi:hypothetical protein
MLRKSENRAIINGVTWKRKSLSLCSISYHPMSDNERFVGQLDA